MSKKLLLFIFLLSFSVITNSCKKDKPEDNVPSAPAEKTITLLTDNVEPGQVVLAQASEQITFNLDAKVSVNGQDVAAFDAGNNQVGFLMPVLPTGKVSVDYTKIGIAKKLEVNIKPYAVISDPANEMNMFTSELDKAILNMEAHVQNIHTGLDPSHIDLAKYVSQTLKDNFSALSEAEKEQAAYFFRNNAVKSNDFILATANDSFYIGKKDNEEDPGEALVKKATDMKDDVTNAIIALASGTALAYTPEPTQLSKALAIGAFGAGVMYASKATSKAAEVGKLTGVAEKIMSWFQKKEEKIILPNNRENDIYFNCTYRTLSQADKSSANQFIHSVFESLDDLQDSYNSLATLANKVASWSTLEIPKVPHFKNPILANPLNKVHNLPGNKLSIHNISNTEIKINSISENDHLVIKAISETLEKETDFNFNVIFTDKALGISLEKQIEATFKPKIYSVLDDLYKWVVAPIKFQSGKARSFFISDDFMTKASGIDYSEITYENATSGSKIQIVMNKNTGSFTIIPSHEEKEMQYANIKISYKGKVVQTVGIEVASPCLNATAPIISLDEVKCTIGKGNAWEIYVSFEASGDGAVIGSGSGSATEESELYPVRLYFTQTGLPEKNMANNGYDVELVSGNVNKGVVKISIFRTPTQYASCDETDSYHRQTSHHDKWIVKMRDKCMNWSNEVSFSINYWTY